MNDIKKTPLEQEIQSAKNNLKSHSQSHYFEEGAKFVLSLNLMAKFALWLNLQTDVFKSQFVHIHEPFEQRWINAQNYWLENVYKPTSHWESKE